MHSFIWILNAPNIGNETEYLAFIEKGISANLTDPVEQLVLFELVKLYQIHSHPRKCWKYNKKKCQFSYGQIFTDKTIISKPLNSDIPQEERDKNNILVRNILDKVKEYIDTNLYPAKTKHY